MTTPSQKIPGVTTETKVKKTPDRPHYWVISGGLLAIVGAVLVFALKESDPAALGVDLHALGGVLFAVGVLLIAAGGIQSLIGNGNGLDAEGVKSVGGLIAVLTGIVAVTALAIITTQVGDLSKDSIVAITSSAFGIISTVIGAYLGIKISSEASEKANSALKSIALKETGD